ncbi:MAG: ATP-binding protein [Sulfurospirillaceae bacterium]|nr:ATP-binding protein [Sulfurospirillaceae bacterium]
MQYLIDFLENKNIQDSKIFGYLKCSIEEALILKYLAKNYINGSSEVMVLEILKDVFSNEYQKYLDCLPLVKSLMEQGWIAQENFLHVNASEITNLELLNSSVSLSSAFLKILEEGTLELTLPEITAYADHLEYLKDQFSRIDLYQKLAHLKQSVAGHSPSIGRIKNRLQELENRIDERITATKDNIVVDSIFKEHDLNPKEQLIFLALLKEEYSGEFESLRDMNNLINLISFDDYEKIKNRSLLEDGSKLIESLLIDYDEMLNNFGGVSRSFFISEDILQKIMHPNKEKKNKKIKLDMLIEEQELFELIDPRTNMNDVVLHPKTREVLDHLLKQIDTKVLRLLREWGIKERRSGIDARVIFYGPPGTGKTMTALSLAKTMKKRVLSFDCSKILSKYIGESEKNVRNIFDTYKDLCQKTKSEPLLLLNEADQFLSSRGVGSNSSADKMHNQMQNIFLEQIEKFEGILIATTNLLETIDPAFSRRFDYKIEFAKPNLKQRLELWRKMLPENALYSADFTIEKLATYPLTGGQIKVVLKNTALSVAIKDEPIFSIEDFINSIERETKGAFGEAKTMGFMK